MKLLRFTADGFAVMIKITLCIAMFPLFAELLGIQTYCVQSGSMEPVLKTGSIILAGKADEVRPGDIITFKKWDVPVTHRVVKAEQGTYVTKGDANTENDDGVVTKKQLLGKVIRLPGDRYCIPYMGYFQTAVTKLRWEILGSLLIYTIIRQKKGKIL